MVGSNEPCVAVTRLVSPRTSGDEVPCVTTRGEPVGREKLCREDVLAAEANWL